MRNGLLGSLAIILASGWAWGQVPAPLPGGYAVQVPMYGGMPGNPAAMGMPPYGVQVPMYGPRMAGPMPGNPSFMAMPPRAMPVPLPMPGPPLMYGPLLPAPYPLFGPPPSGPLVAAPGPASPPPATHVAEPMARVHEDPTAHHPPEQVAPPVPAPGSPLWSNDPACYAHPACPPPCELDVPWCAPRGHRFYGQAAYLFWFVRQQEAPALLSLGQVGQPGSRVVGDGGLQFETQERQGGRINLGVWLNRCQTVGVEAGYFFLGPRTPEFLASTTTALVLQRPFFNTATQTEDVVAVTGNPGTVLIEAPSRMQGAEANLRVEFVRRRFWHLDGLLGFRFFQLEEGLNVQSNSTLAGTNTVLTDHFGTQNNFYGGQAGLDYEFQLGRLSLDLWFKFALGNIVQEVDIAGTAVTTTGGVAVASMGGLLAQPSNIGSYTRDRFTVLPEAGITFTFRILDNLRFATGYSILFVNNTVRPGTSIDRNINPTQTGAAGPVFQFRDTTFWAQGVNVGLEFRY